MSSKEDRSKDPLSLGKLFGPIGVKWGKMLQSGGTQGVFMPWWLVVLAGVLVIASFYTQYSLMLCNRAHYGDGDANKIVADEEKIFFPDMDTVQKVMALDRTLNDVTGGGPIMNQDASIASLPATASEKDMKQAPAMVAAAVEAITKVAPGMSPKDTVVFKKEADSLKSKASKESQAESSKEIWKIAKNAVEMEKNSTTAKSEKSAKEEKKTGKGLFSKGKAANEQKKGAKDIKKGFKLDRLAMRVMNADMRCVCDPLLPSQCPCKWDKVLKHLSVVAPPKVMPVDVAGKLAAHCGGQKIGAMRCVYVMSHFALFGLVEHAVNTSALFVQISDIEAGFTKAMIDHVSKLDAVHVLVFGPYDTNEKETSGIQKKLQEEATAKFNGSRTIFEVNPRRRVLASEFPDESISYLSLRLPQTRDDAITELKKWIPKVRPGGFVVVLNLKNSAVFEAMEYVAKSHVQMSDQAPLYLAYDRENPRLEPAGMFIKGGVTSFVREILKGSSEV
eukprot:CAMPEP_0184692180 /NCGR_PEP_ID=MMETSP0313-20130426/765_1 /TAXON_ID=2792 /ORGANISM="Porphyridium aerugineum, Strain SAG 1380-2" /LENGTH=503 /DNA_ID=CAMNT_0027149991 /DNA_START=96 /DNA_END=1607 /DNA_ORIENTATION=-